MFHAPLVNSRCLITPGPLLGCRAGHVILDQMFAQVHRPKLFCVVLVQDRHQLVSAMMSRMMSRNTVLAAGWRRGAVVPLLRWIHIPNHLLVRLPKLIWRGHFPDLIHQWHNSENQRNFTWEIMQHQGFIVGSTERSSKGWSPWAVAGGASWGGGANTVHGCFQEEWKPWRCPIDVWRSQSCYHLTGSLGSYWAQTKVSPGTRQMMNLGCKILSVLLCHFGRWSCTICQVGCKFP